MHRPRAEGAACSAGEAWPLTWARAATQAQASAFADMLQWSRWRRRPPGIVAPPARRPALDRVGYARQLELFDAQRGHRDVAGHALARGRAQTLAHGVDVLQHAHRALAPPEVRHGVADLAAF